MNFGEYTDEYSLKYKEFTNEYGRTYVIEKVTAIARDIEDAERQEAVLVTEINEFNEKLDEAVVFGFSYDNINTIQDYYDMCDDCYAWVRYDETLKTVKRGALKHDN